MKPASASSSFTLIELMAAATVLSLVLLFMVGMQDQMSRAWTNANRRMEATREARAGLRMLTEDFLHYYIRDIYTNVSEARANYNPCSNAIPMAFFSNAATTVGGLTISNAQPGSQALFFLCQRKPPLSSLIGGNSMEDQPLAVGYYVAWMAGTNINGTVTTNYHLFRYYNTNTYSNLVTYFANPSLANLFPNVGPSFTSNNEILTRNALNLRIYFYPSTSVPTTGIVTNLTESSGNIYSGNRCAFELTTYPETVANSVLQGGAVLNIWTNSNNIRRYGRTYETMMDLERGLSK